jgi:hypothetical protein
METHDENAMKKPVWPRGAPIPSFKSYADEVKFWHAYDFDSDQSAEGWEEVPRTNNSKVLAAKGKGDVVVSLPSSVHKPKSARLPKSFPLTITLDDRAVKRLAKVAQANGTSMEGALGEIVQTAIHETVSVGVGPSRGRPRKLAR